MPSPNEITAARAARLIGQPDAPVFVDLCLDEDFALDPALLPGAFRHPHDDLAALVPHLADRAVVLYCQRGKKLSQGAAALLRTHGVRAEYLAGGQVGWREAGLPLVPAEKIPTRTFSSPKGPVTAPSRDDSSGLEAVRGCTLWVTRHRPKVDRVACAWLIRRFVDPCARFLFVAPGEVAGVAEHFDATPFDVDGAFWGHRGERCTFDTMLGEWSLGTDALRYVADVVRGADTNRLDLAPEAAGLLAVSLGLSRLHRDDLVQIEAGFSVHDALHRWARDARDERHEH